MIYNSKKLIFYSLIIVLFFANTHSYATKFEIIKGEDNSTILYSKGEDNSTILYSKGEDNSPILYSKGEDNSPVFSPPKKGSRTRKKVAYTRYDLIDAPKPYYGIFSVFDLIEKKEGFLKLKKKIIRRQKEVKTQNCAFDKAMFDNAKKINSVNNIFFMMFLPPVLVDN